MRISYELGTYCSVVVFIAEMCVHLNIGYRKMFEAFQNIDII